MLDLKKIVLLSAVCLILLCIIPAGFAISEDVNQSDTGTISAPDNDYYFDASQESDDGDGSYSNPYKYLTADRIKDNANHYLSEGEYEFTSSKQIKTSTIIGSGADKTSIRFNGGKFIVNNRLTLINLTIYGETVYNYGVLEGTNSVFSNGAGAKSGDYDYYSGGSIYNPLNGNIILKNCTFISSHADYGGSIYMGKGCLNITDCRFIDNYANHFGGAIACEKVESITISNTNFTNNTCINGAGGAIYIRSCQPINLTNVEITSSEARFGSGVTCLNTTLTLTNSTFKDNAALISGGAIFQMYGKLTGENSYFINNSALNGGGVFADKLEYLLLKDNEFANNIGSAIYSIFNQNYNYNENRLINNDIYSSDTLNLEIGNGNYTLYRLNESEYTIDPVYSLLYDNYTTPVKDQGEGGNCWAFTSISALESCLKKITGIDFNLSEENMKNLAAFYSDYGIDKDANSGGFSYLAWEYLASWLGPINDIDDIYGEKTVLSPVLDSVLHVQNILFLTKDSYEIKNAIMKYGAVVAKMYYYKDYLKNCSYYCPLDYPAINHDVIIIGWDDNYSRYNFKQTPEGDGAWLVQSSWGEKWADRGYAYVSYYDKKFLDSIDIPAYTFILNETVRFDKNYQYDIIGTHKFLYNDESNVWYKSKFISTGFEVLAGVSTYFEKATNWTVYVYVNGELKSMKSGSSNAGYWTISPDELIQLYEGDEFEISFNTVCEGQSAIPVCENSRGNVDRTSYISYDGSYWINLFESSQTSCIKAFTILNKFDSVVLSVDYDGYNPVHITATVADQVGNFAEGNVTFNLSGEIYSVELIDGNASITYNFTERLNSITARFENITNTTTIEIQSKYDTILLDVDYDGYNPVNITATVLDQFGDYAEGNVTFNLSGEEFVIELIKGNASLTHNFNKGLNSIIATFNNLVNSTAIEILKKEIALNLEYAQKLLNIAAGEAINSTLIVYVNNDSSTISLVNGSASYSLSGLSDGTYTLRVMLEDFIFEGENQTNITIRTPAPSLTGGKDIVMYYGANRVYTVKAYQDTGVPAAKGEIVKITINSHTYKVKVNDKGIASFKINLKPKTYTITAEYKNIKVKNKVRVKTTLITKNIKVKKGKVVKFKVKLLNSKGKALKNKKVTIKFKGKKYRVKTNKKGNAVLKIKKLKAGKYKIITSYSKLKNTNRITVKK